MIATESNLWTALEPVASAAGILATRMEVSTALGVGDVEYVGSRYHGWIELKISGRKLTARTQSEYTTQQAAWLCSHQNLRYFLRSWLLCAHPGAHGWRRFTLATPAASLALLSMRTPLTWLDYHIKSGVHLLDSLEEVVHLINA